MSIRFHRRLSHLGAAITIGALIAGCSSGSSGGDDPDEPEVPVVDLPDPIEVEIPGNPPPSSSNPDGATPTAGQQQVREGANALADLGEALEPGETVADQLSDIIAAMDAVSADDPGYQAAQLVAAMAESVLLAHGQLLGDGSGGTSVADLLEENGATISGEISLAPGSDDLQITFDEEPAEAQSLARAENGGRLGADAYLAVVNGPIASALASIEARLARIGPTFEYYIEDDHNGDGSIADNEQRVVDFGDVQFMLATIRLHQAAIHLVNGWDVSGFNVDELEDLEAMHDSDNNGSADDPAAFESDLLDWIENHPSWGTADADAFLAARGKIIAAWVNYQQGSQWVRQEDAARRAVGVITLDAGDFESPADEAEQLQEEADFRVWMQGIMQSIAEGGQHTFDEHPGGEPLDETATVDFGAFFAGVDLREVYFKTVAYEDGSEQLWGPDGVDGLSAEMVSIGGVLVSYDGKTFEASDNPVPVAIANPQGEIIVGVAATADTNDIEGLNPAFFGATTANFDGDVIRVTTDLVSLDDLPGAFWAETVVHVETPFHQWNDVRFMVVHDGASGMQVSAQIDDVGVFDYDPASGTWTDIFSQETAEGLSFSEDDGQATFGVSWSHFTGESGRSTRIDVSAERVLEGENVSVDYARGARVAFDRTGTPQ